MEADGVQTPKPRRRANRPDTGSPEPKPHIYPDRERAERITSSPYTTEGFHVDEGYTDPPRPKSSTVRMGPSPIGPMPQVTQTPPTIPRRQQAAKTRQLSPRPTQKMISPPEIKAEKPGLFAWLKQMHWLFLIGIGMISALVLWLIGSAVLAWGTQRYYDFRYGNPRTYQADMVVGHGGDSSSHPSHFIAMNMNGRVVVIELKAGDPKQAAIYDPQIAITDGAPVTLSFKDVNGDHKLDMIIDLHLPGQDQYSIFINDNDTFRPASPKDSIQTQ